MALADELAGIQQAHHLRLIGLQDTAGDLIGSAWDRFAGLGDLDAADFTGAATVICETTTRQVSTLAVGYMGANDRLAGHIAPDLRPVLPTIRGGAPSPQVYQRSIVEARRQISRGATFDEAMAAGRSRAVATARTDVVLANRAEMARGGLARPWVVGYRRVLTGNSCGFCALASTQRYHSADLLPLHPGCDCDVAEILGAADPGQIINRQLLNELKAAGVPQDVQAARALPDARQAVRNQQQRIQSLRAQIRAETDQLRETRLEQRLDRARQDLAGRQQRVERLRDLRSGPRTDRVVVNAEGRILGADGNPLQFATRTHGELGEVVGSAGRADDAADVVAKVRRTKAVATDPDVLAEATRRNMSPDEVLDFRDAQLERRALEDRARRAAARELSADSPEVMQVARAYGVHPDEVLTARTRVAEVRKLAREEAARVQADALRELDRFEALRIKSPPRTATAEWDWLEQVGQKERSRLAKQWYGGELAPDQVAAVMSDALGRDLSVDEAMELWLNLNRRAEAAGALRRGRLPSPAGYSDAIDSADLLRGLSDLGYDVERLFADDLAAAGHIAAVDADLVQREALDFLGAAANAIEGPAPFRMSFGTWEEEVRELEYALREGFATAADRRRYSELVPQYLDEPDLGFEDLYARIVSTARKAGEEVPDHAVIPW